jgi:hypothetical protein
MNELPRLKPSPGELTVECPKCHQHVSETCCAYQEFDYYKDCHCWITRDQHAVTGDGTDLDGTYYSGAATDPDNAARERLKEYFGAEEADHFLAWLWIGGFKVVPLSTDAEGEE